jgi:hypothetical protein
MPDWTWLISMFVFATIEYFIGYKMGTNEHGKAPTENAWINIRKYKLDTQKEIEKYKVDKAHEFNLKLMERGVYDHVTYKEEDNESINLEEDADENEMGH